MFNLSRKFVRCGENNQEKSCINYCRAMVCKKALQSVNNSFDMEINQNMADMD